MSVEDDYRKSRREANAARERFDFIFRFLYVPVMLAFAIYAVIRGWFWAG